MSIVDAVCLICNRPMNWLSGTPQWHGHCHKMKITVAKGGQPGDRTEVGDTKRPARQSQEAVQKKAPV